MNKVQATTAIKQRILDGLAAEGAPYSTIPVVFDNEASPSSLTFFRLNVVETGSQQYTLGSNAMFRRFGIIKIKIATPRNAGTTKTTTSEDYLVRKLRKFYESKRFGSPGGDDLGVICYDAPHRTLGVEGELWTSMVEVSFRYDERRDSIDA